MSELAFKQLIDTIAARIGDRLTVTLEQRLDGAATERTPWMNITGAAAYLDLPKQRLYKLTAQGAIPHYKQDGRLLFNRQELDDWMTQFRQPADWISAGNRAISP